MTIHPLDKRNTSSLAGWENVLADDIAIVWGLVILAWAIALLATATGYDHLLHYDQLFQPSPQPFLLKLLSFLASWQVMVIAMMLPTSLPLIRLFVRISEQKQQNTPALLSFLAAYLAIWMSFAGVTFLAGWGAHHIVDRSLWLQERPWFFSGIVLLLAGIFQFTSLKDHCITVCRHPFSFLVHYYETGLQAAWNLGLRHGLYCLGCCWALMLIMFVVGVEHLTWMLLLTGVMLLEKSFRWGQRLVPSVGIALITLGTVLLLNPNLPLAIHH
jgi:predicted metal-binding membrane protein